MKLSIIIPAYNEEKRIPATLESYGSFFKENAEIIVILNNCIDNTENIVKDKIKKYPNISYATEEKIGKGNAIIKGIKEARGEYICFVDADSSTEPDQIKKLYDEIQNSNFAGLIGSRWVKGAVIKKYQPIPRIIASRAYNLLVRIILGLPFKDTQCGAKIFQNAPIKEIIDEITPTKWEFDVALLYPLFKKGYKIKEVPIIWEDKTDTNLKIWPTATKMFKSLLKIRFRK
ncbi:MAG: glycosyltransferase [Nanoarchaeota archaeon]